MMLSQSPCAQNIQKSAEFLLTLDIGDLKTGRMDCKAGETLLYKCDVCLDHFAAAIQAGMDANDSILVTLHGSREPREMPMAQLHAWCILIRMLACEYVYRPRIQQALRQAGAWVNDLQDLRGCGLLSSEQTAFAAESGRSLLQVLRDAESAGVTERMLFDLNGATLTLAEVRRLGRYVASAGSPGHSQNSAALYG